MITPSIHFPSTQSGHRRHWSLVPPAYVPPAAADPIDTFVPSEQLQLEVSRPIEEWPVQTSTVTQMVAERLAQVAPPPAPELAAPPAPERHEGLEYLSRLLQVQFQEKLAA